MPVEAYDPATNTWATRAAMRTPRSHPGTRGSEQRQALRRRRLRTAAASSPRWRSMTPRRTPGRLRRHLSTVALHAHRSCLPGIRGSEQQALRRRRLHQRRHRPRHGGGVRPRDEHLGHPRSHAHRSLRPQTRGSEQRQALRRRRLQRQRSGGVRPRDEHLGHPRYMFYRRWQLGLAAASDGKLYAAGG